MFDLLPHEGKLFLDKDVNDYMELLNNFLHIVFMLLTKCITWGCELLNKHLLHVFKP